MEIPNGKYSPNEKQGIPLTTIPKIWGIPLVLAWPACHQVNSEEAFQRREDPRGFLLMNWIFSHGWFVGSPLKKSGEFPTFSNHQARLFLETSDLKWLFARPNIPNAPRQSFAYAQGLKIKGRNSSLVRKLHTVFHTICLASQTKANAHLMQRIHFPWMLSWANRWTWTESVSLFSINLQRSRGLTHAKLAA